MKSIVQGPVASAGFLEDDVKVKAGGLQAMGLVERKEGGWVWMLGLDRVLPGTLRTGPLRS